MALPTFFKRKDSKPASLLSPDPLGDDPGPVQAARTRARRRLIGAVVLLAVGVIGFPMLFETQPRPLPKDIPIELPRREGAAPRPAPVTRGTPAITELPPVAEAPALVLPAASAAPEPAPAPAPTPETAPAAAETKVAVVKPPIAAPVDSKPSAPKPGPAKPAESKPADSKPTDGERARTLLEGRSEAVPKPASAASATDSKAGRFVVQVGAYTDANTLRDVRAKVEKLGLKTYTQSIDTDAGKRTRVRVGPFVTRQEAESASGKLKSAGLPGNVLTL